MRFQQNQRDKLKEHFREHVYYRLCKEIYYIFLQRNNAMAMTAEDLFCDASVILDRLLTSKDIDAEICKDLWQTTFQEYRQMDANIIGTEETKAEVAMLEYCLMSALRAVDKSHYAGELHRTLHNSIHTMWGTVNCQNIERSLYDAINNYTGKMYEWMNDYFISIDNLTEEIDVLLNETEQVTTHKYKETSNNERHEELRQSNVIFKEKIIKDGKQYIFDFCKLWLFFNEHCIQSCKNKYEWFAIFLFANNKNMLKGADTKSFSNQMKIWYPDEAVRCPDDFRHFSILIGRKPEQWKAKDGNKNCTQTTIDNLKKRYNELEKNFIIQSLSLT